MDKSQIYQVQVDPYEHCLLTSNPKERNAFHALLKEYEGDYCQTLKYEFAAKEWAIRICKTNIY